jgi:hypothetical protein
VIVDRDMRVFFSGDSGYFDGFKEIGAGYGPFDLTMVETGAYDPQWPDVHMQPEESLQAHIDLRGKVAAADPQRHLRPVAACLARSVRPHYPIGRGAPPADRHAGDRPGPGHGCAGGRWQVVGTAGAARGGTGSRSLIRQRY